MQQEPSSSDDEGSGFSALSKGTKNPQGSSRLTVKFTISADSESPSSEEDAQHGPRSTVQAKEKAKEREQDRRYQEAISQSAEEAAKNPRTVKKWTAARQAKHRRLMMTEEGAALPAEAERKVALDPVERQVVRQAEEIVQF